MGRGDDRVQRMEAVRRLVRLGQHGMTEAALAVDLARVPHGDGERRRRARPNGDIGAPGEGQDRPRVARRSRQGNVADDGGDAKDLRLLVRAGVKERQRVVDSGVDIDDHGLSMLGHGVILPAVSSTRHDLRQMQRKIVAGRATQRQTRKPRRSFLSQRVKRRIATTARPSARPIHTPTAPSGVIKPKATPTGAPIAQ